MADEGPVRGLPAWVWAVVFVPQGWARVSSPWRSPMCWASMA